MGLQINSWVNSGILYLISAGILKLYVGFQKIGKKMAGGICKFTLLGWNSNYAYYIVLYFFAKKIKCNYFRVFLTNALRYRELKLLKCNTQLLLTTSFVFFSRKKAKCKIFGVFLTNARGYRELKFLKCNTQILLTTSFFFFLRKKAKCEIFGVFLTHARGYREAKILKV